MCTLQQGFESHVLCMDTLVHLGLQGFRTPPGNELGFGSVLTVRTLFPIVAPAPAPGKTFREFPRIGDPNFVS